MVYTLYSMHTSMYILMHTHTLTGGEARCEVEELLQELAEAELGKHVMVTAGVAI